MKTRVAYMNIEANKLREEKRKTLRAAHLKKSPRTYPKNPNDMNEVITCSCGEKEFNGLMYWRDGKQYCRRCMHKIWRGDGYTGPTFKCYYPEKKEVE